MRRGAASTYYPPHSSKKKIEGLVTMMLARLQFSLALARLLLIPLLLLTPNLGARQSGFTNDQLDMAEDLANTLFNAGNTRPGNATTSGAKVGQIKGKKKRYRSKCYTRESDNMKIISVNPSEIEKALRKDPTMGYGSLANEGVYIAAAAIYHEALHLCLGHCPGISVGSGPCYGDKCSCEHLAIDATMHSILNNIVCDLTNNGTLDPAEMSQEDWDKVVTFCKLMKDLEDKWNSDEDMDGDGEPDKRKKANDCVNGTDPCPFMPMENCPVDLPDPGGDGVFEDDVLMHSSCCAAYGL